MRLWLRVDGLRARGSGNAVRVRLCGVTVGAASLGATCGCGCGLRNGCPGLRASGQATEPEREWRSAECGSGVSSGGQADGMTDGDGELGIAAMVTRSLYVLV